MKNNCSEKKYLFIQKRISMQHKSITLLSGLALILFSCIELPVPTDKPDNHTVPVQKSNTRKDLIEKENRINKQCGFDKYLSDPGTPKIAKELLTNSQYAADDESLKLFDRLNDPNPQRRLFYFKVVTRISDGYFSEQLGKKSADFVQNRTPEFLACFDYPECIAESDLQVWADNVSIHLKSIKPEQNPEQFAEVYLKQLSLKSKKCTPEQLNTLKEFSTLIRENWSNYMREPY